MLEGVENESCGEEVLAELPRQNPVEKERERVNCGSQPQLGYCSVNIVDIQIC